MFLNSADIENYSEIKEGDILFVDGNFPFMFKTKKSLPIIYLVSYSSFGGYGGSLDLHLLTPKHSFTDVKNYYEFSSYHRDERVPKITKYEVIGHEPKDPNPELEDLWPKYKEKVLVEGKFIPKETGYETRDIPKPLDVDEKELKVGDEIIYTDVNTSHLYKGKIIKFSSTNLRVSINGRWGEEIRDCNNVFKI